MLLLPLIPLKSCRVWETEGKDKLSDTMETKIYKINSKDDESVEEVALILKNGGLAAVPTETVYGLAANALDGKAVKKIFEAKGRPSDNPLIVHISNMDEWAGLVTEIPEKARLLAEKFWPGPLTIILEKSDIIPDETSGKLSTVGVRMPDNEITRAIIEKAGVPLAAPSANTSGKPSPTNAAYVMEDMKGKIDAVVDGGSCQVGVESTVITLTTEKPLLLRPGGVTPEMIEEVIGEIDISDAVFNKLRDDAEAQSPGMKYKHYSPKAKVVIVKGEFSSYKDYVMSSKLNKVALCFEEDKKELSSVPVVTYGKAGDSFSQAARLFDALREVDEMGAEIAYARFPVFQARGHACGGYGMPVARKREKRACETPYGA